MHRHLLLGLPRQLTDTWSPAVGTQTDADDAGFGLGWYSGERESACDVYSSFSLSLSKELFNDLFTQLAHT